MDDLKHVVFAASVFCIVAMNDIVYAGGEFALSGSTPVRNVARYNLHLKVKCLAGSATPFCFGHGGDYA